MKKRCIKCGSVYELTSSRTIFRDNDSIKCQVCGNEIYSWNEAKIWSTSLIIRNEDHKASNTR